MTKIGDNEFAAILYEWWNGLEHNRGERAALRRAKSPAEVVFSPAYHQLLHQLQQKGYTVYCEALAAVAGLAAHVKE
ncbi:MAG: type I-E CRISPR-associated protein Cse2/CasB, partial [bacterium]|nr:type I-E CRISPR-associated protein Cse2/CasB [bacterium]